MSKKALTFLLINSKHIKKVIRFNDGKYKLNLVSDYGFKGL